MKREASLARKIPAHAVEGRLPRALPEPGALHRRALALGLGGHVSHGPGARRVLPGLLLAITVFVLLEKVGPKGGGVGRVAGIAAIVAGALALFGYLGESG